MDKIIKTFQGKTMGNQRLHITEENWTDLCGNFVVVKHSHGDDSVTTEYFTYEEGEFLLAALDKIYNGKY